MTSAEYDRLTRTRRTASTYFRKATGGLHRFHDAEHRKEVRWLLGYEACRLLESALDEATFLTACLDGDQVDECLAAARALVADLEKRSKTFRRRGLAAKLANTRGRTPAEAALFEAGARELLA